MDFFVQAVNVLQILVMNGQWLKSITFKLPIIEEDLNISLENDEQVERENPEL